MILYLLLGFLAITLIIFFVIIYNNLILVRKNIDKAWGNIEVLLKQRHDEIQKLVEVVKQYRDYEKELLTEITEMRTKAETAGSIKERAKIEEKVSSILTRLFAVAENYPELKANQNFVQLQKRISELENMIADRREFYNDAVTIYNIRINQIPYNIIAKLLGYKEKELFKVEEEEKKDVNIRELFES